MEKNELSQNAMGGTELMLQRLHLSLDPKFLENYQIIPSRVRDLDETKLRVYWAHDLAHDPEAEAAVGNGQWIRFHRIVFVSHWQRNEYIRKFDIPPSKTVVLQNAITPIDEAEKPKDKINLIYHTTPHRGLALLVPVFKKLAEKWGDKINLDVYSSFAIYGWQERDEQFKSLFKEIEDHPNMTYHGYKPNGEVRDALASKAHIFAYPSIWPETSCISLMEAMSARCLCVHPDYAALPETAANWTFQYSYHEEPNRHAGTFYNVLDAALAMLDEKRDDEALEVKLMGQKKYADVFYAWEKRRMEWEGFLESFKNEPREMQKQQEVFVYRQ
jgi:UDP-glucose:(glucosyl)LPS alpha-1,2-glucosyltransferase